MWQIAATLRAKYVWPGRHRVNVSVRNTLCGTSVTAFERAVMSGELRNGVQAHSYER